MKSYLSWALVLLFILLSNTTLMAEENTGGESGQLSVEKIVEDCEKQYTEETYPDPDERNKLIDQCIDDNTGGQPAASE